MRAHPLPVILRIPQGVCTSTLLRSPRHRGRKTLRGNPSFASLHSAAPNRRRLRVSEIRKKTGSNFAVSQKLRDEAETQSFVLFQEERRPLGVFSSEARSRAGGTLQTSSCPRGCDEDTQVSDNALHAKRALPWKVSSDSSVRPEFSAKRPFAWTPKERRSGVSRGFNSGGTASPSASTFVPLPSQQPGKSPLSARETVHSATGRAEETGDSRWWRRNWNDAAWQSSATSKSFFSAINRSHSETGRPPPLPSTIASLSPQRISDFSGREERRLGGDVASRHERVEANVCSPAAKELSEAITESHFKTKSRLLCSTTMSQHEAPLSGAFHSERVLKFPSKTLDISPPTQREAVKVVKPGFCEKGKNAFRRRNPHISNAESPREADANRKPGCLRRQSEAASHEHGPRLRRDEAKSKNAVQTGAPNCNHLFVRCSDTSRRRPSYPFESQARNSADPSSSDTQLPPKIPLPNITATTGESVFEEEWIHQKSREETVETLLCVEAERPSSHFRSNSRFAENASDDFSVTERERGPPDLSFPSRNSQSSERQECSYDSSRERTQPWLRRKNSHPTGCHSTSTLPLKHAPVLREESVFEVFSHPSDDAAKVSNGKVKEDFQRQFHFPLEPRLPRSPNVHAAHVPPALFSQKSSRKIPYESIGDAHSPRVFSADAKSEVEVEKKNATARGVCTPAVRPARQEAAIDGTLETFKALQSADSILRTPRPRLLSALEDLRLREEKDLALQSLLLDRQPPCQKRLLGLLQSRADRERSPQRREKHFLLTILKHQEGMPNPNVECFGRGVSERHALFNSVENQNPLYNERTTSSFSESNNPIINPSSDRRISRREQNRRRFPADSSLVQNALSLPIECRDSSRPQVETRAKKTRQDSRRRSRRKARGGSRKKN